MNDDYLGYLSTLLPGFFGPLPDDARKQIAERFRFVRLERGQYLYRQGEEGNGLDIVLAGRLDVLMKGPKGSERAIGRMTRGDCAGEVALLTGGLRTANVVVSRTSVLAHLDKADFAHIVHHHPEAAMSLARFSIERLSATGARTPEPRVRTVALVPLDPDVPIDDLGARLELALLRFGSTTRFDRRAVRHRFRDTAAHPSPALDVSGIGLEGLFDEAENEREFVIYQAEPGLNDWTARCLAQADRILFVANAMAPTSLRPLERELQSGPLGVLPAETDLVLLYPDHNRIPRNTGAWLEPRRIDRHYHLSWEGQRGVRRLARFLSGKAVTLVLGGGGARGFSQIGVIRAIREAGVPIDAVGGSSIGAILAGAVGLDWQDERILQSIKRAFVDERPLNDFTLPLFALLRGEKASRALRRWFGDVDIVDMWTPYFCVTTNLSRSCTVVHRSGTLWRAMRASVSLPGVLPPFLHDGALHVDGGILDNLPVEVMKDSFGGRIIAVDASVREEYLVKRENVPSPLEHLRERFLPRDSDARFPTLSSVLIKSTVIAGSSRIGTSRGVADLYLNPPTAEFDFLDWGRIYELTELGYRYARQKLPEWIEQNPDAVQHDELFEFRSSVMAGPHHRVRNQGGRDLTTRA